MDTLIFGEPDLSRWERRPFHDMTPRAGDRRDEYTRTVATEPPGGPGAVFARLAEAIAHYRIFPPDLVRGVIRRPIQVGDTVGIHFVGFPLVRLFFAARAIEVLASAREDPRMPGWVRAGFTYRTLVGHPELGEETFAVEKQLATGDVRVALRSWSRPGTPLARAGAPIVRRAQVHASHRALAQLAAIARTA